MKKRVYSILSILLVLPLLLTSCDVTKLAGLEIISRIDASNHASSELYTASFTTDTLGNDAKMYTCNTKLPGEGTEYTELFEEKSTLAGKDGVFLLIRNPSELESMRLSLVLSNAQNQTVKLDSGLMNFSGEIVLMPSTEYISVPAGFYGLLYCPFDASFLGRYQLSAEDTYSLGFSLVKPLEGQAASIYTYTACIYRISEPQQPLVDLNSLSLSLGGSKVLQDFEDSLDADFVRQTHATHIFDSNFYGGVLSGSRSLLITNSSNNNETYLLKSEEQDAAPLLEGSALSNLDFTQNGASPWGMSFLISLPGNYDNKRNNKNNNMSLEFLLQSNGSTVSLPSSGMTLYEVGNSVGTPGSGTTGLDVQENFQGMVVSRFEELTLPENWDWTDVSFSIRLTGIRYSNGKERFYNYRDVLLDDFTALYDKNLPDSLLFTTASVQSCITGHAFERPLEVLVENKDGLPVAGVTVTFTFPTTGAGVVADSETAVTDDNGIARLPIRANDDAGVFQVRASVGALQDEVQLQNFQSRTTESETEETNPSGSTATNIVGIGLTILFVLAAICIVIYITKRKQSSVS